VSGCSAIRRGEFLTIVGPSGCGKSTLLNLIAGLQKPTGGAIGYDGGVWPAGQINTSIGYVYVTQEDNLLPWRTAAGRSLAGEQPACHILALEVVGQIP
jgi:NitT/TauT family transport system ATP-binding protein